MYKIKIKITDIGKDPKLAQAILAEHKVEIAKSSHIGMRIKYIIYVEEENVHDLLYALNTKTEYGARVVSLKSVKK